MLKKIKNIILTLTAAAALAVPAMVPAMVYAQGTSPTITGSDDINKGLCEGVLAATGGNSCAEETTGTNTVTGVIKKIINLFSLIIGAAAVIMIIYGGFKYITSGGNDSNVGSAKNTILYAIIGLIIVAFAQIIVRFVLTRASGA